MEPLPLLRTHEYINSTAKSNEKPHTQAMKETYPGETAEMSAEIGRVLHEREELRKGAACRKPGSLPKSGVAVEKLAPGKTLEKTSR